jgi:hypothetical protein
MLARRLLLYTSQTLQWRCATTTTNLVQSFYCEETNRPRAKILSQIHQSQEEAFKEWLHIVKDYSRRAMSMQSDKLPAIAAMAERFAPLLGNYYAGICQHELMKQLTWYRSKWPKSSIITLGYRAPSWSWTSLNVRVHFLTELNGGGYRVCCSLMSIRTTPKDTGVQYSEVLEASITLRGQQLLIWIDVASNPSTYCEHSLGTVIVYEERDIQDSPPTRFYKAYFMQSLSRTQQERGPRVPITIQFDSQRRLPSHAMLVCKCLFTIFRALL